MSLDTILTPALLDVIDERRRQMKVEGWTPAHDDEHANGELGHAAACYAVAGAQDDGPDAPAPLAWPWDAAWWKPKDRRRNLVRAAALILAEIERGDRAQESAMQPVAIKCPTCQSTDPQWHRALSVEGEARICSDAWHESGNLTRNVAEAALSGSGK